MVVGITSFGAYVPIYRLKRDEISRSWGTRSLGGERAVAKHDEDSLTMAVAATLDCIKNSRLQADGLFFASTTSPYKEKQAASIIAASVDLPEETRTADFTDSLRSGTIALSSAIDAVRSGSAQNVIVAASDCRMGAGKSQFEQLFGDGAAALAVGDTDVIAAVEGTYSVFSEFFQSWRPEGGTFVQSWEERFIINEGYMNTMQKVVSGVLSKYKLCLDDFAKVVFYAPDPKSHAGFAGRIGLKLEARIQDPLFHSVGNTGTAALPMMVVAALCEARPEDRILVVNYTDGADAFVLRVTEKIEKLREADAIARLVQRKKYASYERYLNWRGLLQSEDPRRPDVHPPSLTCLWRQRRSLLSFYGSKCRRCGTVQYPPQRICANCRAKDDFEEYKLSDKKGQIFTYAEDYLAAGKEVPALICVADFEGGARVMCEMTECEPSDLKIGMPVEMCFRKLEQKGTIRNYFWKARPSA